LTGQITSPGDFADDDFRKHAPRFQGENFQRNLDLVQRVKDIAATKGCTPGQLAIAWLLAQGDDIVPIPGTKRLRYLEENLGGVDVTLSDADVRAIDEAAPKGETAGDRYASMSSIDE
jgi:aryl-alcohol dehydrogenase-like predicted oxidoreductase